MHVLTLEKLAKDGLLAGKRVLIRSDLNAPHDENGRITNETRLVASVPAIRIALDAGAAVMVMSHLGRPAEKGYEADFSLKPVAEYLAKLLGRPVAFAPDCANADKEVAAMKPGDVLMLENTRFYKEEQGKLKQKEGQSDEEFKAKKEKGETTPEDLEKLKNFLITLAANWSLNSNAKQHPLVRYYLEAMLTRGEIKHPRSAALVKEILRKASLPEKAGK